jgi:predicted Rossmann fold nucleotide-binding protein DprA/Smf involved in DNA uptake
MRLQNIQPCLFCGATAGCPHVPAEPLYGAQGDIPYQDESDTSEAAAAVLPDLQRLEQVCYDAIRQQPQTCDALEQLTGLSHQTASARLRGLVLRQRIQDSGTRTRTRTGRLAVVWEAR